MEFPYWKCFENLFLTRNIQFDWVLKAKNRFLNHWQNFCPGQFQYCPGQKIYCPSRWTRQRQFQYCPGKKYFVRANGRGKNEYFWLKMNFQCLVHLPKQKRFCPEQTWNCPEQKFCPGLKFHILLSEVIQKEIFSWKSLENSFSTRIIHFEGLVKAKNGLFNPWQFFCLRQFQYCPGQKIFCSSRWTRH